MTQMNEATGINREFYDFVMRYCNARTRRLMRTPAQTSKDLYDLAFVYTIAKMDGDETKQFDVAVIEKCLGKYCGDAVADECVI